MEAPRIQQKKKRLRERKIYVYLDVVIKELVIFFKQVLKEYCWTEPISMGHTAVLIEQISPIGTFIYHFSFFPISLFYNCQLLITPKISVSNDLTYENLQITDLDLPLSTKTCLCSTVPLSYDITFVLPST